MNKLTTWLKNLRLNHILTAFLVGLLLFVSTACGNKVEAKTADQIRKDVPSSAVTNEYKGGMNDYSDVDPRRNTTEANTKAKALLDNAKKNTTEKIADSPQQIGERVKGAAKNAGDNAGDYVDNLKNKVGDSVDDVKENVSKGTQKSLRKTQNLADDLKDKAIQTKENTKDAAQDAAKSVKRAADDLLDD